MSLERYINTPGEWFKADGPESDIAFSSRVRLARNLENLPFSHWANQEDLKRVVSLVRTALAKSEYLANAEFVELKELSLLDRQFLVERHLISHELSPDRQGCVAIGDREMISIMINEEDHLRLQSMVCGLQLLQAWQILDRVDDKLSQELDYAVSIKWGYLTACPTNVGTGMRASVMLHLPALTMTGQIKKMPKAISQLGMVLRGFYGEGTSSLGDLFQVSNQTTLGQREEEIIENIERITHKIIEHERNAQEIVLKRDRIKIEDRIHRAYGLLQNARIISSKEAMDLVSALRLGVRMGLIPQIRLSVLNELMIIIQPAHIQKWVSKVLKERERDIVRAELIHQRLKMN